MHYFQWNIKSYQAATLHLSNAEDLAYRRLLEHYYDTEQPIPTDNPLVSRRLRLGLSDVESMLKEFFVLTEKGWEHPYCDMVILEYHAFMDKQRANGAKGGRPSHQASKPKPNPLDSQNNPSPTQQETINNKPLTTNKEKPIAIGKPNCPHEEIINLYHELLPSSPRIKDWTATRASALKTRWSEKPDRQNLEYWDSLFKYIAGIPFLTGQVSSAGRKPFMVSLDWLCKAENFAKVREGRYEQ